jgi:hypothetical protein
MRTIGISIIAALTLCACSEGGSQATNSEVAGPNAADVDQANVAQANVENATNADGTNKTDVERRVDRDMVKTVAEKRLQVGSPTQSGSTTARTVDRAVSGSLRTAEDVMPEASGSS